MTNHRINKTKDLGHENLETGTPSKVEYVRVRKYAHSSFSSLVQSLLSKDNLLRTYLTSLQLVNGTVWRRLNVSLPFTIV